MSGNVDWFRNGRNSIFHTVENGDFNRLDSHLKTDNTVVVIVIKTITHCVYSILINIVFFPQINFGILYRTSLGISTLWNNLNADSCFKVYFHNRTLKYCLWLLKLIFIITTNNTIYNIPRNMTFIRQKFTMCGWKLSSMKL